MRYIFIFAAIFISIYTGAFFYTGFKDFNYSAPTHQVSIPHSKHTS